MRLTQDAQVIPSMGSWISAVVGSAGVADVLILLGSIHVETRGARPRQTASMPRSARAVPLAVATLAGPDGPFHLAVSDVGVVAATSGWSREGFESTLTRRFGARSTSEAAGARLASVLPVLEALLAHRTLDHLRVPVDLHDGPAFDRAVLLAVREVPWGQTASYGEIARRVGAPRAARAVGGAVGRCPIELLIPCHRVIAADGTLGGYGGDGDMDREAALRHKRALLLREGVTLGRRAD